jgi:hypothetical protein
VVQGRCSSYWFEEDYVVYLEDNGYIRQAARTTEVAEDVGKIESIAQNLNKLNEVLVKNKDGMASFICLVCGCVNVTLFLLLAILVVAILFK